MANKHTSSPRKKRLINKRNRSAWIISIILIALMALRLVAGFVRPSPSRPAAAGTTTAAVETPPAPTEQDKAESAVQTFFNLLAEKRYTEAATYFGGSYETLAAAYPQDAGDEPHLLQDACEHSQCLPVHSITVDKAAGSESYHFAVTFAGADGRLFTQTTADGGQISQFSISVANQNGRYLVQNLPLN